MSYGRNAQTTITKKRKFINDGIFYAEVNEFLRRMLKENGYAGVEVRSKPNRLEVVIRCTKTTEVVTSIPQITKLLQLRYGFTEDGLSVYADKVSPRGLSASAQAQSICYKLMSGLTVRRACYGVLKFIMDNGQAKGVEIIVSGKLRGARAKAMKFKEGYMITSGEATNYYIERAVEHVLLRQGTIGISVKIMLPHDPKGQNGGVVRPLPDVVQIKDPKEEEKEQPQFQPQPEPYGQPRDFRQQENLGYGGPPTQDYGAAPQQPQEQGFDYSQQAQPKPAAEPAYGNYGAPTPGYQENTV